MNKASAIGEIQEMSAEANAHVLIKGGQVIMSLQYFIALLNEIDELQSVRLQREKRQTKLRPAVNSVA